HPLDYNGAPKVRQATGVRPLPVDDRTVVRVVRFLIAPVVTDLVSQSIFVQLDAEAGAGRQFDIPIHHLERIPDVTLAQAHLLLAQEIGNRGRDLQARGERNGAGRVVWGNGGEVGFSHSGDKAHFGDASRVTQVRLQDRSRALLEDLPESPFREDALTRGDGQVGAAGNFSHEVDILAIDGFFYEHRLIGFERLDQQLRGRRGNRAVKINPDVSVRADSLALKRELLDGVIDKRLVIDDASRPFLCRPGLECRESLRLPPLDILRRAGMRIDADPLPRRSAEELVNRNVQRLSLDVPKRLIDAAERAGQNRAVSIKGVTIDGLPVMGYRAGVFSDQIRLHFLDRLSAGERAPLRDRLPETGDGGRVVDAEEEPPG